jgi:secondary thiamine-phosphate synthase enzyme
MAGAKSFTSAVRIEIRTSRRVELKPITSQVSQILRESQLSNGLCLIYVPHTTAGVTINENADPDVAADLEETLARMVPAKGAYRHREGNADAHVKASLVGSSVTVLVQDGELILGTWQGVFFCEFDGPRSRSVYVKLIEG